MVPSISIVQHITNLLNRDWSVKLVHFSRESIDVVDRLANSEDDDYVVSNHEDSDNPIKDSENDLADNGDEVCDVHVGVCVGVGRDIPGFSTAMCENEEMDNESDGSDLLQNALKQYVVLNGYNVRLKVNDSRRLQVICKVGCPWMTRASRLHPKNMNERLQGQHT
ncbi:hypothetical protein V6N11_022355 [Hibiscus sabdariffa]|uniref:Transposase MuDR plant domain-containing protein n=1 Tax=Hibiscus sabdariffa TaxID=183260 RepID=A0ABR2TJL3_9ROSI